MHEMKSGGKVQVYQLHTETPNPKIVHKGDAKAMARISTLLLHNGPLWRDTCGTSFSTLNIRFRFKNGVYVPYLPRFAATAFMPPG